MLKNLAYLSTFTTFVVIVWVAMSIYNSIHTTTVPQDVTQQIAPLPPTFDASVIDSLKQRSQVPVDLSEQFLSSESAKTPSSPVTFLLQPTASPTPTASTAPTTLPTTPPSTQSATLNQNQNNVPTPTPAL